MDLPHTKVNYEPPASQSSQTNLFKYLQALFTTILLIFLTQIWWNKRQHTLEKYEKEAFDYPGKSEKSSRSKLIAVTNQFFNFRHKFYRQKLSNSLKRRGKPGSESSLECITETEEEFSDSENFKFVLYKHQKQLLLYHRLLERSGFSGEEPQENKSLMENGLGVRGPPVPVRRSIEAHRPLQHRSPSPSPSPSPSYLGAQPNGQHSYLTPYTNNNNLFPLTKNYSKSYENGLNEDSGHYYTASKLEAVDSAHSTNGERNSKDFLTEDYYHFNPARRMSDQEERARRAQSEYWERLTPEGCSSRVLSPTSEGTAATTPMDQSFNYYPNGVPNLPSPKNQFLQVNGKQVRSYSLGGDLGRSGKSSRELPQIVVHNELDDRDRRRTSLVEAYPYVKSDGKGPAIGITRNRDSKPSAVQNALADLAELDSDFAVQSSSLNARSASIHDLRLNLLDTTQSDKSITTPLSSLDGLSASLNGGASSSSNDRIHFTGLTKEHLKAHKDIEIRKKKDSSSDDNYSVDTREMLDEITDVVVMIRCRNKACAKIKEIKEARQYYKMCHNCFTYYCSKTCREIHWERHKIKCVYSRVNTACKKVLKLLNQNPELLEAISSFSEAEFDMQGRGTVFICFETLSSAEVFLKTRSQLPKMQYITVGKMGRNSQYFTGIHSELTDALEAYNPDSKLILTVAIDIKKFKESNRKVIPRCPGDFIAKFLKMRKSQSNGGDENSLEKPNTLLLTSAVKQETFDTKRQRELFLSNLQRTLRAKNVNLRMDFPSVYQQLCSYVNTGEHFAPITIYPHDPIAGKQFMCLIMPDSEPNFLGWVNETLQASEVPNINSPSN